MIQTPMLQGFDDDVDELEQELLNLEEEICVQQMNCMPEDDLFMMEEDCPNDEDSYMTSSVYSGPVQRQRARGGRNIARNRNMNRNDFSDDDSDYTNSSGESENGDYENQYMDHRLEYYGNNKSQAPLDQGVMQSGVAKCVEYIKSNWRGKNFITDQRSNQFWVDLASYLIVSASMPDKKDNFVSENFKYLSKSLIPIAVAYVNLDFEADTEAHVFEEENG